MIGQIELIGIIMKAIGRRGHEFINARQTNAIIQAANDILAELSVPHKPATENIGLSAWIQTDDTGMSSGHMAFNLSIEAGMNCPWLGKYAECNHPHDPDDFGRCYRLLRSVPELRPHIPKMASSSQVWASLVEHWDELERLYEEELPKGKCPKLYKRMQQLIDDSK